MEHLFFLCPLARVIIWWSTLSIRLDWNDFWSFKEWLYRFFFQLHKDGLIDEIKKIIILLNHVWLLRNSILHKVLKFKRQMLSLVLFTVQLTLSILQPELDQILGVCVHKISI